MRVLFYLAWSIDQLGGAEVATQALAQGLAARGHDVGVVETVRAEPPALETRTFRVPVWAVGTEPCEHRPLPPAAVFAQFLSIVSKFKPEILAVQCPSWGHAVPIAGALGLPHKWRLTVALHGSELLQDPERQRLRPWLHRLFDAAAAVTAVSESLCRDFRAQYPMMAHKVCVIPNGVDARWSELPGRPRIPRARPYVLYAGRFDRIKGVDLLLRAWKGLDTRARQIELWLAGAGAEENNLRALARDLGVAERVRFLGRVAQQDLAAVFRDADLVVIPSRHEGLPRVALEAGVCGAVCIATRVGGIPEVIEDAVTGFLVAPESPAALADGLLRGLGLRPEDRRRIGTAARTRTLQQFTHARNLDAHERLFRSLVDAAARGMPAIR